MSTALTLTENKLSLSPEGLTMINLYLCLPFPGHKVSCPYYNNRRQKLRGALRVLIGKGEPGEIVEEAKIISLRDGLDIAKFSDSELKKFLVKSKLGVECSAFAYHVLNADIHSRTQKKLASILKFGDINPLRFIITKLRPAENTSVRVLSSQENSVTVELSELKPGCLIIMLDTGLKHDYDHVLLIHEIQYAGGLPTKIFYSHSFQWTSDGLHNHGVKQGQIIIANGNKPLLDQQWIEQDKINEQNETWQHAKMSKVLTLKRLKAF